MQTPEYFHCIDDKQFRDHVYEPEADSFLLLDALDLEASKLRSLRPRRCVEIGCGSGIAVTHLYTLLHNSECEQVVTKNNNDDKNNNILAINESTLDGDESKFNTISKEASVTKMEERYDRIEVDNDKSETHLLHNMDFYAVDINPKALEATSLTWEHTLRKYMSVELEEARKCVNVENYCLSNINNIRLENKAAMLTTKSTSNMCDNATGALEKFQLHLVLGDLFTPFSKNYQIQEQQCHKISDRVVSEPTSMSSHFYQMENEKNNTDSTDNESNRHNCNMEFDVILFNPPYVPTSMEELELAIDATKASQEEVTNTSFLFTETTSGDEKHNRDEGKEIDNAITAAWCGGPRGRVVIDRFIAMLPSFMSRRGVCYLVLIKENEVEDVISLIHRTFALHNSHHSHELKNNEEREKEMRAQSSSNERTSNDLNSIMHIELITSRYTGEHLGVYRIAYVDNSVFANKEEEHEQEELGN